MNFRKRTALGAGLLLLSLLGCNLPRPTSTPGIEFPTPNLTMTALFSPGGILGTSTPPPVVTATGEPQTGGPSPAPGTTAAFPGLTTATQAAGTPDRERNRGHAAECPLFGCLTDHPTDHRRHLG